MFTYASYSVHWKHSNMLKKMKAGRQADWQEGRVISSKDPVRKPMDTSF